MGGRRRNPMCGPSSGGCWERAGERGAGRGLRGALLATLALSLFLGVEGAARPLLAGSLNWAINSQFRQGSPHRKVTFTLRTAFELDTACDWRSTYCTGGAAGVGAACGTAAEQDTCVAGGGKCGKVMTCPGTKGLDYGVLCVDQYQTPTMPGGNAKLDLNPAASYTSGVCQYDDGTGMTGTANRFEVVDVRRINGVKIVFGELRYTVSVADSSVAIIAYFANNVDHAILTADKGVLGPYQGVLMPQCDVSASNPTTPCGVNIRDTQSPPTFGLFKDADGNPIPSTSGGVSSSVGSSVFWGRMGDFTGTWPSSGADSATSVFQQSPSLETLVQLCSVGITKWGCSGVNGTETISNYYSPVAAAPAFPQFAVTSLTQAATSTHPVGKYWWFRSAPGEFYKAPHPPIWLKTYDYDGHMMTVYDFNSGNFPLQSNLRAECFSGQANGVFAGANPGSEAWPFYGDREFSYGERKCRYSFGDSAAESAEDSRGNLLKLDFDFGGNSSASSVVYNDNWYRCGSNNQACNNPGDPCYTLTGQTASDDICSGSRMFSQHVINGMDLPFVDVDNAATQNFEDQNPTFFSTDANPRSSISQSVFSAHGCYAGPKNQPPRFVKSLDLVPQACNLLSGHTANDTLVESEYRCKVGEPCVIPLHAVDFNLDENGESTPDATTCVGQFTTAACQSFYGNNFEAITEEPIDARFQSCDVVQIYQSAGWDKGNSSLRRAACSLDTTLPCVRDADCGSSSGTCTGMSEPMDLCESGNEMGSVKCFHREMFGAQDVGKYVVRCYEAKDPQGDHIWSSPSGDTRLDSNDGLCQWSNRPCNFNGFDIASGNRYPPGMVRGDRRTCSSPPMCFRIFVEGKAPSFVAPTPLESNSYDDNGVLVPGRTDVAACEGYPLKLTLTARDPEASDLVRIYLEDSDVSADNADFFVNSTTSNAPLSCAGTVNGASNPIWQGFVGYGATKVGDNFMQQTVESKAAPKAIATPYLGEVAYTGTPSLDVSFKLEVSKRNGIVVRNADPFMLSDPTGENCVLSYTNATGMGGSCREKLVNMDQVVCAYAYDNSHSVWGRWIGKRNPNGVGGSMDHSNGDMASQKHCWRIRMLSPPVFITGPDKEATPFSDGWSLASEDGSLVTGNAAAYPVIHTVVGGTVTKTLFFADANVEDSVKLFVLGDPSPPRGLVLSATTCIPTQGRCGASDVYGSAGGTVRVQTKASACSRGKATLTWSPGIEHAGKTVDVCLQPRDSSTLCKGQGPADATAQGWYGEVMCLTFVVGSPVLAWHGSSDVMAGGAAEQSGYVGCTAKITAVGFDESGGSSVAVSLVGDLPPGGRFESADGPLGQGVVTFVPQRGMEGSKYTVCFSVKDVIGVLEPLPAACRTVTVARCQYCIKGGDTLAGVTKRFGLDTNWLRLWLHNGNENPAGSELPITVDNPDMIVNRGIASLSEDERRENALGQPVLWVGPVYDVKKGEGLAGLAGKFRTTVSAILSVNPDVRGDADVAEGTPLCLIPCSQLRKGWGASKA